MKFDPNSEILDNEELYRIIRPFPDHWNFEENRLSSGAFKSSIPLSVDRDGQRKEDEVIEFLQSFHHGISGVAKISALSCKKCETTVIPDPISENEKENIKANPFHALINGKEIVGTKGKHGKCLNKNAVIVRSPLM